MKDLIVINSDVKPKSIIIDGNLHNNLKLHCKGKSLKIGGLVEDLIRLYIKDPKTIQKLIEESKEVKINYEELHK